MLGRELLRNRARPSRCGARFREPRPDIRPACGGRSRQVRPAGARVSSRNEIENALVVAEALGARLRGVFARIAEQALENRARIDLRRHRRGAACARKCCCCTRNCSRNRSCRPAGRLRSPVRATQARRVRRSSAPQSDPPKCPTWISAPGGLLRMHAGQEARGGARMIAGAIAQGAPVLCVRPESTSRSCAVGLERLQDAREFELGARRPPASSPS